MKRERYFLLLVLCFSTVLFSFCGKTPEESAVQSEQPATGEETIKIPEARVIEVERTRNVPIEFFGMVTDEQGNPVELAEITADVKVQNQTPPEFAEVQEQKAYTDPEGRFSFEGISGIQLTIREISRDGYEDFQKTGNPSTDYYYSGANRKLYSPSEETPVSFFLLEYIEPTYLIRIGQEEEWEVGVQRLTEGKKPGVPEESGGFSFRFYGKGAVVHDFVRKMIQPVKPTGSGNKTPFSTDLVMTVTFDVGKKGFSLNLESPGQGGGVLVSEKYLRRAPETGYEEKVDFQPPKGRSTFFIYVKSREPSIYTAVVVKSIIMDQYGLLHYIAAVNPYGGTSFVQARGTEEELKEREAEAIAALVRGQLPRKPQIPR